MSSSVKTSDTKSMTLDLVFRALGDPHRMQIMQLLREREMSAGEILETIDVVQSTLSHHMKSLTEAGAVNAVRRGKWTYYSINEETMKEAESLLHEYSLGTKIMMDFSDRDGSSPDLTDAGASAKSPAGGKNSAGRNGYAVESAADEKKGDLKSGRKGKKPDAAPLPKDDRKIKKGKKGKKNKK